MKNFLLGIIFTLVIALLGGFLYLKQGYMNFQADQKPPATERKLAMAAVDASTDRHAPDTKNPIPTSDENLVAGAKLFLNHCAGCHGLPSNSDSQFGRSFYPPVPPFFKDAPDMAENQNFYIIQHGIRYTGMPAWGSTLNETQIWQVVTFLSNIEKLPPVAKQELASSAPASAPQ